MEEIWKDVKGYEGLYQVSNLGKVKSVERYVVLGSHTRLISEHLLRLYINPNGYYMVALSKNSEVKRCNVHRLVSEAFIPNPDNKPCIDHINTDRTDNRVENLRWVTYKEQMENELTKQHCSDTHKGKSGKQHPKSKPVLQYDKDGNFIREWENGRIAAKELNLIQSSISQCCRNIRNSTGGYIWKYKEKF